MTNILATKPTDNVTNSPTAGQLARLELASPFAWRLWQRQTDTVRAFLARFALGQGLDTAVFAALIAEFTQADDTAQDEQAAVMHGLRMLRNLLMLRWIWQDALGIIRLEDLTAELSEFADACLNFAKRHVYQVLQRRYGTPQFDDAKNRPCADDLAVIAMGKLGGHELNLSSDIDLVFVHQGQGETDGERSLGQKSIDTKKFMQRWGQGIIDLLATPTEAGIVFRVDMRLRPWGEGSELAIHLSALEKYFAQHGRAWERFAWLKARLVTPVAFAEPLDELIRRFVFRYYVDYSAFAALRSMKSLIQNQVASRQDVDNIKLGAGGIRDIEFIVQAFQLIYGGRVSELGVKNCLQALHALREFDYLDAKTASELAAAYRFLRRVEHAIQALYDEQTQRLPTDFATRERLARALNYPDWRAFMTELDAVRAQVKVPFERMVIDRSAIAKMPQIHHAKNQTTLSTRLTSENIARLDAFWHSSQVAKLDDESRRRLNSAYPVLVHALLSPNLDDTALNLALPRLLDLLEAISRRSIYLIMLAENPNATGKLMPMLAASPWIARELASHPVLLDSFLREQYRHLPDKPELADILRQQLLRVEPDDDEGVLNALRFFKNTQVLAVAASDILAERPLMKVSDSLTYIAEVVLQATLQLAFADLVKKHGYPISAHGTPVSEQAMGIAIIGYGKLGGLELSYSSDLDLVFIHDIDEGALTTGDKPISGMRFAMRLTQKIMNYLITQTRDGRAYEIDMRLRPSGQAGMLVVSTHAFLLYQSQKAWAWEHQALVRARSVAGDVSVCQTFADIRKQVLAMPRALADVRAEVAAMRRKMHEHLASPTRAAQAGQFHLKQDFGGLVDIEFMAQFAVLAHAHAYPELAVWSDNVRIFEALASTGLVEAAICTRLTEAYLHIRAAMHRLALAGQPPIVAAADWQDLRTFVESVWQAWIGERERI